VEGLHAQPQLPRRARPSDRYVLADDGRRRDLDPVAAVPLQRARHRSARCARIRRPRRDRAALRGVELLARDEQGRCHGHVDGELPRNTDGEIVVRPKRPHVMFEGYWGRAEATVAASSNWWFHTGDIGRVDDDGFLYFVDRKADYLRRRGENISSFEVESVLM